MSKPRVLFVDDSSTIQQVFEFAFENENVEVLLASDGREAFEKAKQVMPDMVIADVNMPEVDGFELCRLIKGDPSLSSTPVYLLSSSLEEFDEQRAQAVGADGNFNKPFKSEEMLQKVRAVIEKTVEPAYIKRDEDTFDDIDISIDTILDGIGGVTDGSEMAHDPGLDEIDSAVDDALADSPLLDLGLDNLVEVEPDDEEELAVEVISGDEMPLPTIIEDIEEMEEDLDDGEVSEVEPDPSETEDEVDNVLVAEDIEVIDDVEDEIDLAPDSHVIESVNATAANEPGEVPTGEDGDIEEQKLDEAVSDAIREAVFEKLKSSEVEKLLVSTIQSAIDDMKPELITMFQKVAQDITLELAEDMVKKTIDQIKNEK